MAPEQRDPAYLWDMLEHSILVTEMVAGLQFHHYLRDKKLQFAVERAIEIIGEAARRVSETYKHQHPDLPWHGIIAQRTVLAHEYGEIRPERIWVVATERIPELIKELSQLNVQPPSAE